MYLEQNLVAILEDSALIVMFSRRLLKNYENFHFIYNGTKISYDAKSVFSNLPVFLLTYFNLANENLNVEEVIRSCGDEETKKYLRNNKKGIPEKDNITNVCLILCNFFLTHNEVYENNSEGNLKRLKKLYDFQIYKVFNEKIMILKALQTILTQKNIVEDNLEVFTEALNTLNSYVMLGNSVLTTEIFKVYQAIITEHLTIETFETICTSLSLFYYSFQQEIQSSPEPWVETIMLFLTITRMLMVKLVEMFEDSDQENKRLSLAYHLYFLNIMFNYLFSGVPRLQLEGVRALKQTFQALVDVSKGTQNRRNIVANCFEKFIVFTLSKLGDDNISQDIKIRMVDLLLSLERITKDNFKNLSGLFDETTVMICRDPDIVRVYLFNLRNMWRNAKQVTLDILPKIMAFIKCSFELMQAKKPITNQDNELIAEIFKLFVYLQFECPTVNKYSFPESLLAFVIIALEVKVNGNVVAVITQLMQHLYSNIPAPQVKQMLNNLTEEQRRVLCQIIPILQTINEQKIDTQQVNVNANSGQATAEKPVIKLKAFGKK